MTQNDRFFIPLNIKKVAGVCEVLEIIEVHSKYSMDNQIGNYFRWFGFFQCAKMGVVTIYRELEKYLDRLTGYRIAGGACSVKDIARALNVPYRMITDSNDAGNVKQIKEKKPDLIISFSAPQILKNEILSTAKFGVINVHGSLLPDYRGCLPSFWYLYNQEKIGGATVHYMSAKIDDGDIIEQGRTDISDCKSMFQIMKKTKTLGGELMLQAIQDIQNGTAKRIPNETEKGRYFTWPTVEQAREFRKRGGRLI